MNKTEKIVSAIVSMKKLKITYKDEEETKYYVVNPHLIGKVKSSGNVVLSAYQDSVITGSWKTFLLGNISEAELLDEGFEHTAKGYNPKDKRMATIVCSIPSVR